MGRNQRTSPLWSITKEEIVNAKSVSQIMKKYDRRLIGANYKTLKKAAYENGFGEEYEALIQRGIHNANALRKVKNETVFDRYGDEGVFCESSPVSRYAIKKAIIERGLIPYVCRDCGNDGTWNGKSITLQLEHINGISDDHRLENMVFLCPNCHTQTGTYGSKNIKRG